MTRVLGILALCFFSVSANAALLSRADGQAYYDDVLQITWVADANLAKTSGYDTDGLMAHSQAAAWIVHLNEVAYLGVNDWRLPTILDTDGPDPDALGDDGCAGIVYTSTDCGYNVQTKSGATVYSELAHLYYVTLGNPGRYDEIGVLTGCYEPWGEPNFCLSNPGPFTNLQGNTYWTGTGLAPGPGYWWTFAFNTGLQYYSDDAGPVHSWAVRSGDIDDVQFPDADGDGVLDAIDNCTLVANPTQVDSNQDGYGNRCDGDMNDNDFTNGADTTLYRQQLGQPSVPPTYNAADINATGFVNGADTTLFRQMLGAPPGPSGLACAGTVPCP